MTTAIPVRRLAAWTTCIASLALGMAATFVTLVIDREPGIGLLAWVPAAPVSGVLLVWALVGSDRDADDGVRSRLAACRTQVVFGEYGLQPRDDVLGA